MTDHKRSDDQPKIERQDKSDEASKGQYGGLTGLGPGGGSDIEEALEPDEVDLQNDASKRK